MELFENLQLKECSPQPLEVVTPLGTIELIAVVGEEYLTCQNSTAFYVLDNGDFAMRWELSCGVAEAILRRPDIIEECAQKVTDCQGILWRFKAHKPVEQLNFRSIWKPGYNWKARGPDSGQYFGAQTWWNDEAEVTIGTEDDEGLFLRAERNDWLPRRFLLRPRYDYDNLAVQYLQEGMAVNLGEVLLDEKFQIYFGIAWHLQGASDYAYTSFEAEFALERYSLQRK